MVHSLLVTFFLATTNIWSILFHSNHRHCGHSLPQPRTGEKQYLCTLLKFRSEGFDWVESKRSLCELHQELIEKSA